MAIRDLAKAVLGFAGAFLVWRSRAIQVGLFMAAAALRRRWRPDSRTRPSGRTEEWSRVHYKSVSNGHQSSLALITYHPEYHSFQPQRAMDSIFAIKELGFRWMRSDVRWSHIFPDGTKADAGALAWHREFLQAASNCGLRNMVVLSTPPDAIIRQAVKAKLEGWTQYVELVVSELGRWCDAYQLMNEPNNPVYRFFSLQDAAEAVARGTSIIKASNAGASVVINIAMEVWGWRQYLSKMLELSGPSVNIVGLDHYPGTWTVGVQEHWDELFSLAGTIASASPGSPWHNRRLAIIETGFSTNTPFRGQHIQAEYFKHMESVIAALKRPSMPPPFVGIYELCDENSSVWLDPEAHFGVLTSDLEPKLAFEVVRRLITSLE